MQLNAFGEMKILTEKHLNSIEWNLWCRYRFHFEAIFQNPFKRHA